MDTCWQKSPFGTILGWIDFVNGNNIRTAIRFGKLYFVELLSQL